MLRSVINGLQQHYCVSTVELVALLRNGRTYHSCNQINAVFQSSTSSSEQGMSNKVTTVANKTPYASETAMGIKN